jgi:TolB-like protein
MQRTQRAPGAALGVVVALALLGAAAPSHAAPPVRLAVMELGTAGGGADMEGMGAGLQSMITTDLANVSSSTLVLVERARLRDVVAELKLGRSSLVDASTAAKVGKLAGATHLLTGSVTVAGGKMRIDARLVEVATGRVLLGESIDGQADVFFELEKSLVRKLVDAIALQMTPKERGALARIQTADFEAFRKYGAGLKLFDDKKYEQALKALREASERDTDFSLARTTLAEYERIAAGLRREADGIEQQRAAEAGRKLDQEMQGEQKLIARLFEAAGRKGDAARDTRLTALYLLARDYADRRFKLAEEEDRFAWERTTDALFQRYVTEAVGLYPRFPALINKFDDQGWWKVKYPQPATFDRDLARLAGELLDFGIETRDKREEEQVRRFHRRRSLTLDRKENFARLQLDARAEADLEDRLDALVAKTEPAYMRNYPDSAFHRAQLRASLLDLDASTKVIVGLRADKADPQWLRKLAEMTEANARIKALVEQRAGNKAAREMVMLALARASIEHLNVERIEDDLRRSFTPAGALNERGAADLTRGRQIHGSDNIYGAVLIGNHAIWNVEGQPWTGPRRDPLRADELRFFQPPSHRADRNPFALVIADGVPRRDLRARFQVALGSPPADFKPDSVRRGADQPAAPGADVGRPTVTFLFGVRDIERRVRQEGDDASYPSIAPMRALGLRIEGDRVRLVDLTRETYLRGRSYDGLKLTVKSLADHALPRAAAAAAAGGKPFDVSVAVEGKRVRVSIAGETFDLPLDNPETGFYGFVVEQPGYASIGQLTFEGPRVAGGI